MPPFQAWRAREQGDDRGSHGSVCLFQHRRFPGSRGRRFSRALIGKLVRRPSSPASRHFRRSIITLSECPIPRGFDPDGIAETEADPFGKLPDLWGVARHARPRPNATTSHDAESNRPRRRVAAARRLVAVGSQNTRWRKPVG